VCRPDSVLPMSKQVHARFGLASALHFGPWRGVGVSLADSFAYLLVPLYPIGLLRTVPRDLKQRRRLAFHPPAKLR